MRSGVPVRDALRLGEESIRWTPPTVDNRRAVEDQTHVYTPIDIIINRPHGGWE